MSHTLITTDAMACLSKFGHATVISDKKSAPGFRIIFILSASGDITFIDTTVVM